MKLRNFLKTYNGYITVYKTRANKIELADIPEFEKVWEGYSNCFTGKTNIPKKWFWKRVIYVEITNKEHIEVLIRSK